MSVLRKILPLAAVAAMAACGEAEDAGSGLPTELEPSFAAVPEYCDARGIAKASRDYFVRPEQGEAADAIKLMQNACAAGDVDGVVAQGWFVLATIESAIEVGRDGDPATGALLANAVMAYMSDPTGGDATLTIAEVPVDAGDLGPTGIFAVRGGDDATPVRAHGEVPFQAVEDHGGGPFTAFALWGIETEAPSTWGAATGIGDDENILFYGDKLGATSSREYTYETLAYRLNSFPDVERFDDGQLHVGTCFFRESGAAVAVEVPHDVGVEAEPRMQRASSTLEQDILLAFWEPDCSGWAPSVQQVATLGDAFRGALGLLGDLILPEPLMAAFHERGAGSTGGTPLDFSDFTPVGAAVDGWLEFATPPVDAVADIPMDPIEVIAYSGNGTPIEGVEITLRLIGNNGLPAGASFCPPDTDPCPDPGDVTEETEDGRVVATITPTLYKAGGYEICAEGTLGDGADWTFTEVCSGLIHVKNNN